jgi:hypothetical protein
VRSPARSSPPDFGAAALFYRALSGRDDELAGYEGDAAQHPDTMTRVWLPDPAPGVAGVAASDWYRVALAHRALHHLLGTFDLDLAAFIDDYPRSTLAAEIYATLEDLRVDTAADRLLTGLRSTAQVVRAHELKARPDAWTLPPRAAAAEALVRLTLGARDVRLPRSLHVPVSTVVAAARQVTTPHATARTAAALTRAVYDTLSRLRNVGIAAGPVESFDFAGAAAYPAPAPVELGADAGEVLDLRFGPVAYRDVPGPRYRGLDDAPPPSEGVVAVEPGDDGSGDEDADGADRSDGVDSADRATVDADSAGADAGGVVPDSAAGLHPGELADVEQGALSASGRHEYVYPEWDAIAARYRPDWVLLRAAHPPGIAIDPAKRRAVRRYAHLLPGLIAALERVRPAGRDVQLRLPDGDDLDLDACIEALADLRAGAWPSDRVHAELRPGRRDVAVAFALDLSASTAVRLPPTPDRPGTGERILDLERDAVTLVSEALERIGDAYAIYGFSGAGRDNVVLTVVKELEERFSAATLRRLGSLVPDHTTRMAPAIRHITQRLVHFAARTKILMVVSDGRPFDIDYGQQYGEPAVLSYAIADTARALDEARAQGVRPYLITVDPAGNDYLGQLCDPREYHVITDARELPASLAELYVVARDETRATRSVSRLPSR